MTEKSESVKISRILHAGYVFEHAGVRIAFDTIFENPFSKNCYAFPEIQFDLEQIKKLKFSAVFISHFHDDHCSLDSLNLLDRNTPIYIFCLHEELLSWIRQLGFKSVTAIHLNKPIKIGDFEIIPRRALDEDVDSLFQIKVAGLNILNVVDSWIDYDTLDLLVSEGPWDLIMWPFQTMRELEVISPMRAEPATGELPPEWIEQLQRLKPQYVIASSCQFQQETWSWYNQAFFPISYQGFKTQVEASVPGVQAIRLNPGASINLSQSSLHAADPLPWIIPIGDQNKDYAYDPNLIPPTTGEIARHFASLSQAQTERVVEYCRSGLIEKFQSLPESEDPFFEKPRIWILSVFDHTGSEQKYCYQIHRSEMVPLQNPQKPEWQTEVSIAKLAAALDAGETLTSMYMRVDAPSESEIVDDPLIRCLFNGAFGAYQFNQLQRLLSVKEVPQ